MAEEVQIAQGGPTVKVRNPLGVVGLSLITIGIYYFVWWFKINREMRDLGQARGADLGDSPGKSLLAVTLGALVIVPAIVSFWTTSGRVEKSQATVGIQDKVTAPIIFILLIVIGPVGQWYLQSQLNRVWEAGAEGDEARPTLPEVPEGAPPTGSSAPAANPQSPPYEKPAGPEAPHV